MQIMVIAPAVQIKPITVDTITGTTVPKKQSWKTRFTSINATMETIAAMIKNDIKIPPN